MTDINERQAPFIDEDRAVCPRGELVDAVVENEADIRDRWTEADALRRRGSTDIASGDKYSISVTQYQIPIDIDGELKDAPTFGKVLARPKIDEATSVININTVLRAGIHVSSRVLAQAFDTQVGQPLRLGI